MTCYIFIYINRDMVRGARSHVRRPRVRVPVHDRDCLPVHAGSPGDRDRLPVDQASSAIFTFFLTTRGGEPASCSGCGGASATGTTTMLDLRRRYAFTRPEDLPRARAVWESTF
ncbi:hypothetical protein Taro_046252 [Colocasia esculenta]|uniref:Uncharacterized protein n=1 Tax=Colocasia esculenta TaxID=4460 RepID=A0A843X1W1_COLES|nr:hypothetical protein [Colocasia esculenta]